MRGGPGEEGGGKERESARAHACVGTYACVCMYTYIVYARAIKSTTISTRVLKISGR
jgi:hypothetical protein